MAIGAKLGKFMDKVILIPRRRLTELCPIVQWLATDARSDIQTINFPEEGE